MAFLNTGRVPDEFWNETGYRLAPWDVRLDPDPELRHTGYGHAHIRVRGHEHRYRAILVSRSQARTLIRATDMFDGPDLVIADRITERTGALLRAAGLDYLDSCGGASLSFGGVVVMLSGSGVPRVPVEPQLPTDARPGAAANLFSAGRAQVLAVLLSWPELADQPVRTIAHVAGTSVGLVHDVLSILENLGHLHRGRSRSWQGRDIVELAEPWSAAFTGGLRRKLDLGSFHSDIDRWPAASERICLGGEWAVADLVRPARVAVYARQIDAALIADLRLRTAEPGEANTSVLRRFWTSPRGDVHEIPWVLTYAELTSSKDARVRAVANEFFKSHARP